METFNIIAGIASILGLFIAIFAVNKYKKQINKILQIAIGSNNNQEIKINDKDKDKQ